MGGGGNFCDFLFAFLYIVKPVLKATSIKQSPVLKARAQLFKTNDVVS